MTESSTPETTKALALRSVEVLMRPLARLMIDNELQVGEVLESLKAVLIDECQQRYGIAEKNVSDARISLLTGVHRKDVRRLRGEQAMARSETPRISVASKVVAHWISNARYLNFDQTPKALPRSPKVSQLGEPDFPQLVNEISRDTSARTVLDELIRVGVVEVNEAGLVALARSSFVPRADKHEKLKYLAANVGDHFSAAVSNLDKNSEDSLFLEQSAFSENLSEEQVGLLHLRARQLWTECLQKFLLDASIAEERSGAAPRATHRVRMGAYFFGEDRQPHNPGAATKKSRSAAKGREK